MNVGTSLQLIMHECRMQ